MPIRELTDDERDRLLTQEEVDSLEDGDEEAKTTSVFPQRVATTDKKACRK